MERRIARLESLLADDEGTIDRIPMEWAERDGSGRMIGPSDDATPDQLQTWATFAAMIGSVLPDPSSN